MSGGTVTAPPAANIAALFMVLPFILEAFMSVLASFTEKSARTNIIIITVQTRHISFIRVLPEAANVISMKRHSISQAASLSRALSIFIAFPFRDIIKIKLTGIISTEVVLCPKISKMMLRSISQGTQNTKAVNLSLSQRPCSRNSVRKKQSGNNLSQSRVLLQYDVTALQDVRSQDV